MKMHFELLEETFFNQDTKEEIPGVTVIVDGDFKHVLDAIIKINPSYNSYSNIIANALMKGNNKTVGDKYE